MITVTEMNGAAVFRPAAMCLLHNHGVTHYAVAKDISEIVDIKSQRRWMIA